MYMHEKLRIVALPIFLMCAAVTLWPHAAISQTTKPSSVVSLATMKSQLTLLRQNVVDTVASLRQITESPDNGPALTGAIKDFSTRVKAMDAQLDIVRKTGLAVRTRTAAHHAAWQQDLVQLQNPDIKEKAQSRLANSKQQFDLIIAAADRAKKEAVPFISDIKDVAIYLDADPSSDALKTLVDTIVNLSNQSRSVIAGLDEVNNQIDSTINVLPGK